MSYEPPRRAKVVVVTSLPTKPAGRRARVVVLAVLVLLLFVTLYNLLVASPADDRENAKRRYIDRWYRDAIETEAVRSCLRGVEGEGIVATTFELSRRPDDRYGVVRVAIGESQLALASSQLVQACLELSALAAEFAPSGHFDDAPENLVFERWYRFPSFPDPIVGFQAPTAETTH